MPTAIEMLDNMGDHNPDELGRWDWCVWQPEFDDRDRFEFTQFLLREIAEGPDA